MMDHPETDRMLADELRGILKELRDKNKKLTDEKDAKSTQLVLLIIGIVIAAVVFTMCGVDGRHHYRY